MEPTLLLSDSEILDKTLDAFTFETAKTLFHDHGFLKIENLFSREWIQTLSSAFLARVTYDPLQMTLSDGVKLHRGRYIVSLPFAPPFNESELYANPILLSLMRAFLGSDCILGSLGAVVALPGAGDQHIHSDFEPLFKEQPFLTAVHPPFAITLAVPLVDIDRINGPTKIWSATHRAIGLDKAKIDEHYAKHFLYGPIGSCYFWDYRTYHAGGSNHSESLRPLLYLTYTRRWFRDLNNPDKLILENEDIPQKHASLFPRRQYLNTEKEHFFQSKIQMLFDREQE